MSRKKPEIFISYSRANRPQAERIVNLIKKSYPDVWHDGSLLGGELWWREILRNIEKADIFVYLLSPQSLTSPYCRAEYEEAKRLRKTILPILIDDRVRNIRLDDVDDVQHVDMSAGETSESLGTLFASLNNLIQDLPEKRPEPTHPERTLVPPVPHEQEATRFLIWRENMRKYIRDLLPNEITYPTVYAFLAATFALATLLTLNSILSNSPDTLNPSPTYTLTPIPDTATPSPTATYTVTPIPTVSVSAQIAVNNTLIEIQELVTDPAMRSEIEQLSLRVSSDALVEPELRSILFDLAQITHLEGQDYSIYAALIENDLSTSSVQIALDFLTLHVANLTNTPTPTPTLMVSTSCYVEIAEGIQSIFVRASPASSSNRLTSVSTGEEVLVLGQQTFEGRIWYQVQIDEETSGWVLSTVVEPVNEDACLNIPVIIGGEE